MDAAVKKVVIIGPESTGKSDLTQGLANHFNTLYVPEFAREYLLSNGSEYTQNDLLKIAKGQTEVEDRMTAKSVSEGKKLLFIDTDLNVIKTWSEFVFNSCDIKILTGITSRTYDLFLLTNTDLPWVRDELREYPDLISRLKLFHHYREALICQKAPWVEISGMGDSRLAMAIDAVERLIIERK